MNMSGYQIGPVGGRKPELPGISICFFGAWHCPLYLLLDAVLLAHDHTGKSVLHPPKVQQHVTGSFRVSAPQPMVFKDE